MLCADATKYITGLRGKDAFDVVILDPPRAGSTPAFIDAVVRSKVRKVVYISCNPETLVRDLRLFIKGGFVLKKAVPIDMFPGTSHVETVVLLSKKFERPQEYKLNLRN